MENSYPHAGVYLRIGYILKHFTVRLVGKGTDRVHIETHDEKKKKP